MNSQFATVGFLSLSFFFGLFITRTGRTSGPILTIYTSYDVFLPKDVPFWQHVRYVIHLKLANDSFKCDSACIS